MFYFTHLVKMQGLQKISINFSSNSSCFLNWVEMDLRISQSNSSGSCCLNDGCIGLVAGIRLSLISFELIV
ncbi:hypothetical protein CsatA_023907 [Cannabis sativa]